MKKILYSLMFAALLASCQQGQTEQTTALAPESFVRISGQNLIQPDGSKLFIRGTNLGNWLNPEGYMFGFSRTNSPRFIDEMLCQLVGPDFTTEFWKQFKDNYITRADVEFIASTGANTIRLPFHYKLFTDEDYMGLTAAQDGSSFMGIKAPEGWDLVRTSSEAPRGTYKEIRDARPDQEAARRALQGWIENSKCGNCVPQTGYIRSLGLKAE